jgi:hypothetical protein
MAKAGWSFLQEWAIYEYLMARFEEGSLRIRPVRVSGKSVGRERWVKVADLKPIKDSQFPDIKSIRLKGERTTREAEIKFTTSEFAYHRNRPADFSEFYSRNGFILVLAHDHLPKGLGSIDIFELDKTDFETWCRSNFNRLFNRQVGTRAEQKIWIMYQGPNFNLGTNTIGPGRETHIWCPTENLTGFDLAPGDRVLFAKSSGASTQSVQRSYHRGNVHNDWFLEELYIAEVYSEILSREEYCQRKGLSLDTQLWKEDPKPKDSWRWSRVFEFWPIACLKKRVRMSSLNERGRPDNFTVAVTQVYCYGKSRELDPKDYMRLLEKLHRGN